MYFQDIIEKLNKFWISQGAIIAQPYDIEVGAGTFHPLTFFRSLDKNPWKVGFVQPCRRPTDGRYADNPLRMQRYYQYQVIVKPSPKDIQDIYIKSLRSLGINCRSHDIRFVEDDWESPTLGASGLGWEVWLDSLEITQFTYFQSVGGHELKMIPCEITYGLERIAMFLQNVPDAFNLKWNNAMPAEGLKNNIRRLRFDAGEMTQQALADKASVTRQTIIAIEQGKYAPSLPLAFRIARAFGVKVEDVFQYEQDK